MTEAQKILEVEKCRRSPHYFAFSSGLVTKDEHDQEHSEKPLPDKPYMRVLMDCLCVSGHIVKPDEAIYARAAGVPDDYLQQLWVASMVFLEKSRQVLASWTVDTYLLWRAKWRRNQLILVQSKREEDAANMVFDKEKTKARISFMESHLPRHLQTARFPGCGSYAKLSFPTGSYIWGIPEGGDIIRSNTPSVLFCVDADTRVLKRDLRWVRAGTILPGDELTAFDRTVRNTWLWSGSTVEAVGWVRRPCYRLIFADGTQIIASSQHKWLAGAEQRLHWRTTEELRPQHGGRAGSLIMRLLHVWEEDRSFEAGYLAGFFDGEGYLTQRPLRRGGWNTKLGVSQNPGPTLDYAKHLLWSKGFDFTESPTGHACQTLWVATRSNIIEFLGTIRPPRLVSKFTPEAFGLIHAKKGAKLVAREFLGQRDVIGFKTSTGTFIAEGLASHNSDEAAFQPEFGAAFGAARPAVMGGGQLIAVSSAELGAFAELVEAEL